MRRPTNGGRSEHRCVTAAYPARSAIAYSGLAIKGDARIPNNGVSWNAPAPAVATYPVVPPAGEELAQALVDAPVRRSEREATIAENKARTAEAPLEVEARKSAVQQQQLSTDQQSLARLTSVLTANPQAAASPAVLRSLQTIMGRLGLPVPQTPEGHVDVAALASSAQVPAIWGQGDFSADKLKVWLAEPPEARAALRGKVIGAPEWFFVSPARAPLTPTGEAQIYKRVDDVFHRLGEGKATAGELLTTVNSARQQIINHGGNPAVLEGYLDPSDPSKLNPNITHQLASDYAEAQIRKMEALTGVAVDREKTYKAFTERRMRELDAVDTRGNRRLDIDQQKVNVAERALAVRARTAADNLRARWASIGNTQMWRAFQMNQALTNQQQLIVKSQYAAIKGEYDHAVSQLEANTRAVANGAMDDELIQNSSDLKEIIDTLGPELSAMQTKLTGLPAANYSVLTGHTVKPVGSDGGDGHKPGDRVRGCDGYIRDASEWEVEGRSVIAERR
jgi:hypothetical protein